MLSVPVVMVCGPVVHCCDWRLDFGSQQLQHQSSCYPAVLVLAWQKALVSHQRDAAALATHTECIRRGWAFQRAPCGGACRRQWASTRVARTLSVPFVDTVVAVVVIGSSADVVVLAEHALLSNLAGFSAEQQALSAPAVAFQLRPSIPAELTFFDPQFSLVSGPHTKTPQQLQQNLPKTDEPR